jgi:hypothetical protein
MNKTAESNPVEMNDSKGDTAQKASGFWPSYLAWRLPIYKK